MKKCYTIICVVNVHNQQMNNPPKASTIIISIFRENNSNEMFLYTDSDCVEISSIILNLLKSG